MHIQPPAPAISIITPLYNNLELTRVYINSLERTCQDMDYELIFVDNASTDGTRSYLETDCKQHTVIFNNSNLGYAGANNQGAKIARGEILALINNDIVLKSNWAEPMLHILNTKENVGMVGNVQLNDKTGRIDHAGMVFNREGHGMHYGMNYPLSFIERTRAFPAVTAACCMIQKSIFESVDGFDESYVNGYEDLDLCMRLGERGYKHYVSGDSIVIHRIGPSKGRKDNENANRELFLSKWAHKTVPMGLKQWPKNYLLQHWRHPWRLNGGKTIDSLKMLAGM